MGNIGGYIFVALEPVLEWFSNYSFGTSQGAGVIMVVTLLASACAGVVGVVFMWWGVRKVAQMIMSAFRSGRISL